jgi:hypothetical protein
MPYREGNQIMLTILEFIFSSFWTFAGCVILMWLGVTFPLIALAAVMGVHIKGWGVSTLSKTTDE